MPNLRVKLSQFSLINSDAPEFEGTSRRAINYFPGRNLSPNARAKLALCNEQPILPQLLSIEAEKLSGCIKMESKRSKSRAAVLIYRGRVIACIYGSKAQPDQLFGPEAYALMMSEMSSVHSEVKSYALDEKVVLSAASMFHGEVFNAAPDQDPKESLSGCLKFIEELSAPGSIAVADEAGKPVCFIYLSGGKVLGINSLNPSVKDRDAHSVWQYLQKHPKSQIMANSVDAKDESVANLTFSMLGKSTPRPSTQETASRTGVCSVTDLAAVRNAANLVGVYAVRPTEAGREVRTDRFIKQKDLSAKQMKVGSNFKSTYEIYAGR